MKEMFDLQSFMIAAGRIYEACRLQPNERFTIYSDTGREPEVVEAFLAAAKIRNVDATVLRVAARKPMVEPPSPAVETMRNSDFVLDLGTQSWLYAPATTKILATGARMLQVLMPSSNIPNKVPRPEITKRAKFAESLFDKNETLRVTSADGTDFTANYEGRAADAQDGVVLTPTDWDSLGTAFVNVSPIEETVEGKVVLNSTFYLAGGTPFIATSPVVVTIHQGRITEIKGGAEATRFRAWLESYGDPNLRVIAHVGFGYDELAGPPPKPVEEHDIVSWEALYGGVIVAFGSNRIDINRRGKGSIGGANDAASHADCTILGADFYLGKTKVLERGSFKFAELQKEG
jgi:2,5-dihydroxypyridine 5,6-dioxygenase